MTMQITIEQIKKIAPGAPDKAAGEFVDTFNKWSDKFGITTPLRAAHFISQCIHECAELKAFEENLNYSEKGLLKVFPKYFNAATAKQYARKPEKIANRVYANRMGNGNESSGDGWKYKGRGAIGLTGRSNYLAYSTSGFCIGDIIAHPEWLAKSPGCYKSAMWFWWKNGLNTIADTEDVNSVTKRVNGGYNGLDSRKKYLTRAKEVLGI